MSDLSFFSFDNDLSRDGGANSSSNFDFTAVSPTMSEADAVFGKHNGPTSMHADLGSMWNEPTNMSLQGNTVNGLGKLLTHYNGPVNQAFGQVTPPEDPDVHGFGKSLSGRADSGVASGSSTDTAKHSRTSSQSFDRPLKKARKDSRLSENDDDVNSDGKREKYREKNRVAAAKCRAKKKEHTDHLEENHRAQSALNTALRQTEKTLRDELSFWRTQALQHTFCNCRSIQDYNLHKAQSLASKPGFGRSTNGGMSTTDYGALASSSTCDVHGVRSKSISGAEMSSPMISGDSRSMSFASINSNPAKNRDKENQGAPSDISVDPFLLGGRDIKDFVNDMPS